MSTRSISGASSDLKIPPNCSYWKTYRAQSINEYNEPVINFNSNFDDTAGTVSRYFAPLCRCEAPPPPPPSPARPRQVISTTAAGGTTTAKPKDSKPSTLMIVIIVIVAFIAVSGITFLIYINPEKFRSTDADMNAQML